MKLHFDENVDERVADALRRRQVDVTTTSEESLKSTPDPSQLDFAISARRVIVTHDDDILAIVAGGLPHCGVAFCHSEKYRGNVGGFVRAITAMIARVDDQSMDNRVEYL